MFRKRKRWDPKKYHPDFPKISLESRIAENFTCQFCGLSNGDKFPSGAPVRVAFAHKYANDEANPNPEGYVLCQSCHRIYDNGMQQPVSEELDHQIRLHNIALEVKGYGKNCDHCGMYDPNGEGFCRSCGYLL